MAHRRWLGLVLLIGLALRIGMGLRQPSDLGGLPDQVEYLNLAKNLLEHGTLKFYDARFGRDVFAYRTPGYPAFVALCGASLPMVRIVQAMVDTSTALAVYLLARRWLAERESIVAAALVALNPYLIYFSGLILSETLFTALLAWGIYLAVAERALASAIILVIGVMVRPSFLAMPAALVPFSARAWRGEADRNKAARNSAIALAVLLCALLLWGYRNSRMVNRWILTTTNSGITQYDGFHDGATGASDQSFLDEMPELRTLSETERDERLSSLAGKFRNEHPGESVLLGVKKIARMWSPVPLSKEYGTAKYVAVGLVWSLPLYALALVGLWRRVLPRPVKLLLVMPAVYFTIVHAMSVGSLRYRVPVEPQLAVLAASAVASGARKRFGSDVGESR